MAVITNCIESKSGSSGIDGNGALNFGILFTDKLVLTGKLVLAGRGSGTAFL